MKLKNKISFEILKAWSDNSDELNTLSTAERSKVCKILSENDGEFLLSIDDFIKV